MIPFDEGFAAPEPGGVHRPRARRAAAARRTSRWARTSASGTGPPATPRCWPPTAASRPAWCRWSRSTARSSPRATSGRSSWPARSSTPRASSARRSSCAARSSSGDRRGRTLGFPTANIVPDEALVCPGHGVYAARADGGVRGGQRRRAADVRHRRARAGRGLPARPRRRPVRPDAEASTSSRGCAASGGSTRSRRWSSRCTATSSARASCAADTTRSASLTGRMTLTQERKQELVDQVRRRPRRHRQGRGPGRAADRADQRAHRAPAHPPQGSPLAPRAADARRPPPPVPQLPAAHRPRALPRAGPRARPAPVIDEPGTAGRPSSRSPRGRQRRSRDADLAGRRPCSSSIRSPSARCAPTSSTSTRRCSTTSRRAGRRCTGSPATPPTRRPRFGRSSA